MEKIVSPRVTAKGKSQEKTYMKAPCEVSSGYLNTGWRRDVWKERIWQCFSRRILVCVSVFLCVCVCVCLFGHMALRDCSSLTRDQTCAPCIGSVKY